jgi:hypothetical protein
VHDSINLHKGSHHLSAYPVAAGSLSCSRCFRQSMAFSPGGEPCDRPSPRKPPIRVCERRRSRLRAAFRASSRRPRPQNTVPFVLNHQGCDIRTEKRPSVAWVAAGVSRRQEQAPSRHPGPDNGCVRQRRQTLPPSINACTAGSMLMLPGGPRYAEASKVRLRKKPAPLG